MYIPGKYFAIKEFNFRAHNELNVGKDSKLSSDSHDEAMVLHAQFLLFAACATFIGKLSSGGGQLVWETMSSLSFDENPNFFDMNGSPYFAGWTASQFPYKMFKPKPIRSN